MSAHPSLRLRALGAQWSSVSLWSDVDLELPAGWTGVVGENGAGKTTLLRLIAGEVAPSSGTIQTVPAASRVVLVEQRTDLCSGSVRVFAGAQDGLAFRLRGELELEPDALDRWDTLSGGERKRWQLAAALAQAPEVLLLDEPTTYLDHAAGQWLTRFLARFRGVGLVVSHDRALLDALTSRTLFVSRGTIALRQGSYSLAHGQRAAERTRDQAERREQRRQAESRERALHRAADAHRGATRQRNTGQRMRNSSDSDARSILGNGLAEWAQVAHAQRARAAKRKLEQVEQTLSELRVEDEPTTALQLPSARAPKPVLLMHASETLQLGERVLVRNARVQLGRADRIALLGPNGSGKSTLMAALLEGALVPREHLFVLPQELRAEAGLDALEQVRGLPPAERGAVLALLGALGADPSRLLATSAPSPGEVRKLLLARALAMRAWALILDEPTQHLDLPSVERLQRALAGYDGAVLLITHDLPLARACASRVWDLGDGTLTVRDLETSDGP